MAFLPTVLQYNKPEKSNYPPSALAYYLLFAKWNFVFTLINSGPAKTGPAGPLPTPLEIREVQKCLHPQRHLQSINVTEANRACTEHEIK